jgi:RNA exonuclease 4
VSIVNYNGHVLMDKYVRPDGHITDFRTWVSGIQPYMLKESNGAISFEQAKQEAHRILKNKVIVGHSLHHDFNSMQYSIDESNQESRLRDLAKFPKYRNQFG